MQTKGKKNIKLCYYTLALISENKQQVQAVKWCMRMCQVQL